MHSNQSYSTTVSNTAPVGGVVAMGVAGALITGAVSAAQEIRKVKEGEEDRAQAVSRVAKESLGGGLALATGAVVAKTLFRSTGLGLIAMLAVGAGVKYAYDGFMKPNAEAKASASKTPKTK